MQSDLTRELVTDLRAWYEDQRDLSQKNLARKLYLSPQQLSEIFAGRNRPTGDQVLRIQEFLQTNDMKSPSTYLDPRTTPRSTTNDPLQPKSLGQAKEMIEDLRAQLKGGAATLLPKPAAPAPPKAKTQPAGDPGADPIYPPTGTPGADRPNKTEMPTGPAAPKKALPPEANTPVLIQKILDVTELDDLRLMLNNPIHSPTQQACIYAEVKKRRALVSNRFQ
jgi:transcriptional regulator with XRE-family HTH domain